MLFFRLKTICVLISFIFLTVTVKASQTEFDFLKEKAPLSVSMIYRGPTILQADDLSSTFPMMKTGETDHIFGFSIPVEAKFLRIVGSSYFDKNNTYSIWILRPLLNLESLWIESPYIQTFLGIENCPHLKHISFAPEFFPLTPLADSSVRVTPSPFLFSSPMEFLTDINFSFSHISSFTGLNLCLHLKNLCLDETKELNELVFNGAMPFLTRLSIVGSNVQEIIGLHYCPSLAVVMASNTKKLNAFHSDGPLHELLLLSLSFSGIENISGLEHCQNLRSLDIGFTENLKGELIFEKPMNRLQKLEIDDSGFSVLKFNSSIAALEKLWLPKSIEIIEFSDDASMLKQIVACSSSLNEIILKRPLAVLKELDLSETPLGRNSERIQKLRDLLPTNVEIITGESSYGGGPEDCPF